MNDRASVSWCILNSHVGRRRGKIRQVPCAASVMGFSPLPHRLWWYRERESLWLLPRSIAEWRRWRWALTCTILSAGYSRSIDENLETSFPVWWMTTDVAGYCLAFSALSSFLQSYTFFSYFLREPLSNDDVCPLRRGHCPAVHHQFSCVCGPVYYFANPINYGKKTVVFLISRIGCYKVDFILWLLKNRLAIPWIV